MLHLHLLVATCEAGQSEVSVENDFSFSCAWLSERTPRAFDCPRLCAEGGGVPACPADEVEAEWLASELTTSSCATPDCSVANLLWLGVYRPGESNTRELWDSCMDGGEAYVSYWISESRPLRRPPRGLPAHCSLLLGGQPWTIRTRIGDQWIIDSGDDDDAATPIEAALGSPGGMLDAHCDLLASDDAWPTTKPRNGHKYPCACTSPRPGDESHLGDDSYDEILHHDAAVLAGQFDHAVDRLRADQQATAGIMFGVAIAVWIVLSIILGATDPNVRRALRQVCGGGKKAPAKLTTEAEGQSMSQEEIEAILAASLDAAAFVRVRVGFALRAVGLLLLTIGFAPLLTHVATSGFLTAVVGPYGFWGMFRLIGLTLFCMSVVPSDACGVRALQIFALIGFIVTTLVWAILIATATPPTFHGWGSWRTSSAWSAPSSVSSSRGARCGPSRRRARKRPRAARSSRRRPARWSAATCDGKPHGTRFRTTASRRCCRARRCARRGGRLASSSRLPPP